MFVDSEQESDKEMEEWENQQIRKGVTGAQITQLQTENQFGYNYYTGLSEESIESSLYNTSVSTVKRECPKTSDSIANKLRERYALNNPNARK